MDFSNDLNWDLVLRQSYFTQLNPAYPKGFIPIPAITLSLDSHTLVIGAKSSKARVSWYLAAYVIPKLLFSPSSTSNFVGAVQTQERQRIKLDTLNLIKFTDFGLSPYLLEISIAPWHQEIDLEVWKYLGNESSKPVNELLQALRASFVELG